MASGDRRETGGGRGSGALCFSTVAPPKQKPLKEGVDFYRESGNVVFTPHFLLKRGYCCNSGCRHCPFTKKIAESGFSLEIRGMETDEGPSS